MPTNAEITILSQQRNQVLWCKSPIWKRARTTKAFSHFSRFILGLIFFMLLLLLLASLFLSFGRRYFAYLLFIFTFLFYHFSVELSFPLRSFGCSRFHSVHKLYSMCQLTNILVGFVWIVCAFKWFLLIPTPMHPSALKTNNPMRWANVIFMQAKICTDSISSFFFYSVFLGQ